jgi:hypothetical protein
MVSKLNAAWSNTTNRMVNHATMHMINNKNYKLLSLNHGSNGEIEFERCIKYIE